MVATSDYDIRSISNFDLSFESDLFSTDSVYFSGTAFYDSNGVEYRTSDDEILTTKLGTPATTAQFSDFMNYIARRGKFLKLYFSKQFHV